MHVYLIVYTFAFFNVLVFFISSLKMLYQELNAFFLFFILFYSKINKRVALKLCYRYVS
jgi:hypothetical protein